MAPAESISHTPQVPVMGIRGMFRVAVILEVSRASYVRSPGAALPQVPECLRDLRAMYEAATVDDVHDAYSHFELDDDRVFTCVGTSGPQPPALRAGAPAAAGKRRSQHQSAPVLSNRSEPILCNSPCYNNSPCYRAQ